MTMKPFETIAMPIVAPTMLCVPDTGKFRTVATINQMQQPVKALTYPSIRVNSSPSNSKGSTIPFLIVPDTCAPIF